MIKINTIPHITWRFTEANSAEIDLSGIKYKSDVKEYNKEIPEDFRNYFTDHEYGLSKEFLDINDKFKNEERYYDFEDFEHKKIEYFLDENNNILNDEHGFYIKENMSGSVILDYRSKQDVEVFRNSLYKIKAEKNSELKIVIIQRLSNKAKSFSSLVTDIDEKASVKLVLVELGSDKSYANYKVNLNEEKSDVDIQTAYFVDKDRVLDLGYELVHRGVKSNSNMIINGVLKDNAKKRFAGTLDFKKGCKLSQGNEEEFVTLLDPSVKNFAIPLLLAREDDIVGNHAASAGRIDKDMLFYITSRGFDKLAAKRIIIESKLKPVFDLIDDEKLSEELLEELREGIK